MDYCLKQKDPVDLNKHLDTETEVRITNRIMTQIMFLIQIIAAMCIDTERESCLELIRVSGFLHGLLDPVGIHGNILEYSWFVCCRTVTPRWRKSLHKNKFENIFQIDRKNWSQLYLYKVFGFKLICFVKQWKGRDIMLALKNKSAKWLIFHFYQFTQSACQITLHNVYHTLIYWSSTSFKSV